MAINYEVATVNTMIPARLLSEADLLILNGFGFESADALGNKLYLYAEDGTRAGNEFEVEVWPELVNMLEVEYPAEAYRPEWVAALLAHLVQYGQDDDLCVTVDLDAMGVSWEGVLQGILSKPQNTGEDAIDAIEIMAGYWCDKARPGEFGGWAVRITRDDVQSAGTSSLLIMMAKGTLPAPKPEVSNEEAAYVANGGVRCPSCGGSDLAGDCVEIDVGIAYQGITCNDCGATWTDQYRLIGITEFEVS